VVPSLERILMTRHAWLTSKEGEQTDEEKKQKCLSAALSPGIVRKGALLVDEGVYNSEHDSGGNEIMPHANYAHYASREKRSRDVGMRALPGERSCLALSGQVMIFISPNLRGPPY
jgi:hypothetical protein